MVKHRQAVYVPAAHQGIAWHDLECLGLPVAWLGVPFLQKDRSLGLLSISRNVERPFSSEERETAQAFAQRIMKIIEIEIDELNQKHQHPQQTDHSAPFSNRKRDPSVWFYGNTYQNAIAPFNIGD